MDREIEAGNLEAVKQFLQDPKTNPNLRLSEKGFAPLNEACYHGHLEIVKLLLNDPRVDINNVDNNKGKTPFNIACEYGKTEIVKLFLHIERVDINKPTKEDNRTPLFYASVMGRTECVEYILASGRELDFTIKNQNGYSAIDIARKRRYPDIVKLLELFEKDPDRTRTELRDKLGLLGIFFFLSLFFFSFLPFLFSLKICPNLKLFISF